MSLILWIIFGALVGWVASIIMKTNSQQGAMANIGVGIVGALIGGFAMSLAGGSSLIGFDLYSFLVSLGGAIIFIAALKGLQRYA